MYIISLLARKCFMVLSLCYLFKRYFYFNVQINTYILQHWHELSIYAAFIYTTLQTRHGISVKLSVFRFRTIS